MTSALPIMMLADGLLQRLGRVPLPYLLLWCSFILVTIALIVLMRSRWGQGRPLQKCAVLSLLVHVVFACLAMTVRVVVGDGSGNDTGPPIHVRLVDDTPGPIAMGPIIAEPDTELTSPQLLEPPAPLLTEPAEAEKTDSQPPQETGEPELAAADPPVPAEPAPVSEPPSESAADPMSPKEFVNAEALTTIPATEVAAAETVPAQPLHQPTATPTAVTEMAANIAPVAPAPAVTAAAPAAAYSLRTAAGRLGVVEQQGGNVQTEAAVNAALAWLAAAQSPDGHWDAERFGAGRELAVLGQDRHGAGRNADTAISALALLAFLGAGHSHLQGDYQLTVRRGLEFLGRSQSDDGNIFGNAEMFAQMYCHSMATFALAEAQAMTRDKRLEPIVSRAIGYCLRAQNVSTGGWRYRPGDTGDTSQLGWQMMALASARRAGIDVPSQTWTGIERFLRSVRRGQQGGLASYRPDSPASTSMTAEAFYCRLMLAESLNNSIDERAAAEATAQLLTSLPDRQPVNLYYWYYATLALHHRQRANDQAAAAWHAWNDALTTALLSSQVEAGPDAGSWNTDCLWGGYGGRVYTTAMATMCLEVYYRYAPSPPPDPWMATRPGAQDTSH